MKRPDVVVVGAGPAGLAVAVGAATRGLSAVVVERRRPPLDKPCGEGLMPAGVAALEGLGIAAARLGRPFVGIEWRDEASLARGDLPAPGGVGIRRTVLSTALVERAGVVGVEIDWGVRALGVDGDVLETDAGEYRARWIVAADGLRSKLREAVGLCGPAGRGPARFGVRRHYGVAPWSDRVGVTFASGAEAYVTPVGADEVGVAILWSGVKAGFDELLGRFPALDARLAGAAATSEDRGAGPFRQRVRGAVAGNVALVGDAAGYVDAITGEGVGLALAEADALAATLAGGDLGPYRRARRRLRALPEALCRLLVAAAARPRLRRRLVATMARRPALFSRVLALDSHRLPLYHGPPLAAALLLGMLRPVAAASGVE